MEPNNLEPNILDSSNNLDSSSLDFIISKKECNEAKFEYYLPEELNIKSVRLKSISFFNSWWLFDFFPAEIKIYLELYDYEDSYRNSGHFSLTKLCSLLQEWINSGGFKIEET
ncbi:hypothetical protein, partial [Bartonella sp. CL48QHWL]|uniref:hypothetical protein n=1 Tax=Bartonella sp. CL48QHWL TaxID=3243535 RepID=UPI0035CFCF5A